MSHFKVTGPLQRILALGSLWAGYSKNYWPMMLKLSVYTLYGQRKKPIYFQGQRSNFKVTGFYKEFWHLDPCGQDIARTIQPRLLKLSMYT